MSRRKAREYALKILYIMETSGKDWNQAINDLEILEQGFDNNREFMQKLVLGTVKNMPEIDEIISKYAIGWTLSRMAVIDRALMRIAIFEMLFVDDIPVSVSINEAVDLANKFSTEDSGKFINGILGKIVRDNLIPKKGCQE